MDKENKNYINNPEWRKVMSEKVWHNSKLNLKRKKAKEGKTYEELYGYERANMIKSKLCLSHLGKFPHWRVSGMKGKKATEETRRKQSESIKKALQNPEVRKRYCGRIPWNKGTVGVMPKYWLNKKFSKEHCKKLSISKFKDWSNPVYRAKILNRIKESLRKIAKPNKKERKLMKIFKEEELPYKYVGNWDFTLGGKCPDFVNVNGQKKIIELFGIYWHGKTNRRLVKYHRTEEGTKKHYANFGFQTLVVWEDELENKVKLIERIKEFDKNKIGGEIQNGNGSNRTERVS